MSYLKLALFSYSVSTLSLTMNVFLPVPASSFKSQMLCTKGGGAGHLLVLVSDTQDFWRSGNVDKRNDKTVESMEIILHIILFQASLRCDLYIKIDRTFETLETFITALLEM